MTGEPSEHDHRTHRAPGPFEDEARGVSSAPAPPLPVSDSRPALDEIAEAARFPSENPSPVFRVAEDGKLLYANRASQCLMDAWQVGDSGCIPLRWRERIAEVLTSGDQRAWDEACAGRILQLTCVPIRGAGYVNVYGADVTERATLENRLRESEVQALDLIRHAPTGIYEVDFRTSRFRSVNDAMCAILGYTREELFALTAFDLLDEEGRTLFAHRIRSTLAGQAVDPSVEYRVIKKDGSAIYAVLSTRITYHDGHPDGAFVIAHDVTERRRAADELQALADRLAEQERFLAAILENVPVSIAYLDEDLIYRQCNQAAADEIGQPVESIVGRHLRELTPENPQVWAAVEGVLRTGESFRSGELPVTWPDRPDEGTQYYDVAYLPDKDAAGRVRGVFTEGQRVTALVEARAQLEQARDELELRVHERTAELETIFANIPDPLYVADRSGIVRCNDAALKAFGCETVEDLRGGLSVTAAKMQPRYAATGEPIPRGELGLVRALRGERAVTDTITRHPGRNEDQVHRVSVAPIVVDGKVIAAVALAADITEQNRREEKLAYQAMLLENVNDAIFAYDAGLRITVWNKRAEEQYGWKAGEALGVYAPTVVGSQLTGEQRDAILRDILATGRWQGEIWHCRRDGTPILVEATAMRLDDERGRLIGFVTVNRDITERKRIANELSASREQLRTLSRRLVTSQEAERSYVADQLYNQAGQVLAALQMQLSRLGKDDWRDAPARLVPMMEATVKEAIRELHELAVQLRPVGLDKSPLAGVLGRYVTEFCGTHGLVAECDAGDTGSLRVPSDVATAVYRSVQEGLTNIVRHAHASQVDLSLRRQGNELLVRLADDGVGFEPATGPAASGLGLASVRERLETVGGSLRIDSGAAGTALIMQVPLNQEER